MNEMLKLSEDGKVVLEADHSIIHAVIPEGVTEIGAERFPTQGFYVLFPFQAL